MTYLFCIGITTQKTYVPCEDDHIWARYNNITILPHAKGHILVYKGKSVQKVDSRVDQGTAEAIHMTSAEMHHFQGCIRRAPDSVYDFLNDDFGFHSLRKDATLGLKQKHRPIIRLKPRTIS